MASYIAQVEIEARDQTEAWTELWRMADASSFSVSVLNMERVDSEKKEP